jgi:NAD(P)H-flavin reductase
MKNHTQDCYVPHEAKVVEFIQDAPGIFTLRLSFVDQDVRELYQFHPGQFNMIYLYGVGEVAISIVSDRNFEDHVFEHTIQVVGRVTAGLAKLKTGDTVGVRGPFGSTWPLKQLKHKNVVVMTGGLGNAPLVAAIESILKNRQDYGRMYIIQGMGNTEDLIYYERYARWNTQAETEVILTAVEGKPYGPWKWYKGFVTEAVADLQLDMADTCVMSVGPEIMMKNTAKAFITRGIPAEQVFVSLERNMKCAIGHCGHCQMGKEFICKDGAVYSYPTVEKLLTIEGS